MNSPLVTFEKMRPVRTLSQYKIPPGEGADKEIKCKG